MEESVKWLVTVNKSQVTGVITVVPVPEGAIKAFTINQLSNCAITFYGTETYTLQRAREIALKKQDRYGYFGSDKKDYLKLLDRVVQGYRGFTL